MREREKEREMLKYFTNPSSQRHTLIYIAKFLGYENISQRGNKK